MSRIQVDNIFDKEGTGAPSLPAGAVVTGVCTATSFVGNVSGTITGDVTGDLTGDVTGNVTGNLTGNVSATTVTSSSVVANTYENMEQRSWLFG